MTAASDVEIKIYASFPIVVEPEEGLNLNANNWEWVHCLTLSLETLHALPWLPSKPFKWMRYAIGAVVGAEGHLCRSIDPLDIVEYDAGFPTEPIALYYHLSDEERRRMFPVDSDDDRRTSLSSSAPSTRMEQFFSDVGERDGHRCVLTGAPEFLCDAVHLLAHNKGDEYISRYTQRRTRDHAGGDVVEEINSVRNGLMLNGNAHRILGSSLAFLPTPNFAMSTADVDPSLPAGEERFTAHLFKPQIENLVLGTASPPFGISLRVAGRDDWPPAILFDAVYATAVLKHFGTQEFREKVFLTWKSTFYPDVGVGHIKTSRKSQTNRYTKLMRWKSKKREREAHFEARNAQPDAFDMLMAVPYILVQPNQLQSTLREARERAESKERRRVQEKVEDWMRQADSS
ncbi:LOW QUALITY PROTEIN: hypothetical protein CVT26_002847 [Gymnopilus dilepis]|uniref:HNH nuclease domain-containing protein n=1 Tax=Gymnopilus dilepis TaxID=231916 RepID=A0A409VT98_9AGAR|nr:LOW QUALITY PROTEIN: hypothetical protein CVT26_002847 [Gymnopilus dilepis]